MHSPSECVRSCAFIYKTKVNMQSEMHLCAVHLVRAVAFAGAPMAGLEPDAFVQTYKCYNSVAVLVRTWA